MLELNLERTFIPACTFLCWLSSLHCKSEPALQDINFCVRGFPYRAQVTAQRLAGSGCVSRTPYPNNNPGGTPQRAEQTTTKPRSICVCSSQLAGRAMLSAFRGLCLRL
ncbi:hypothetical protein F5Y17DRAFT_277271 [Xylariaceae sp. FL0594]|nr:hypothetical protein F5Y17DRAFT_277271 [Xylariaceae sp. FL0594]